MEKQKAELIITFVSARSLFTDVEVASSDEWKFQHWRASNFCEPLFAFPSREWNLRVKRKMRLWTRTPAEEEATFYFSICSAEPDVPALNTRKWPRLEMSVNIWVDAVRLLSGVFEGRGVVYVPLWHGTWIGTASWFFWLIDSVQLVTPQRSCK